MDRKYTNQLPDRIRKNNATYETLERNAAPSVFGHGGQTLLGSGFNKLATMVSPRVARINRARIKVNKIKKARGKK